MLQHESTIGILSTPYTELIAMRVIQFLLVYILHNLKTTQANCQARCEETNGPITHKGLANRALVGHSFKNFTVSKPYDCHLLCFVEKCRCQAYQMKGQHNCELLDEDRFAAPDDFEEEQGYKYYDISREYENGVRYNNTNNLRIILVTETGFQVWIGWKSVENTDLNIAPFQLLFQIQWCGCENNITSASVSFSYTTTQTLFLRTEQRTFTLKCIQKIRKEIVKIKKERERCMS